MSHANAALTPRARLKVAQLVVDHNVPIREVAARFQCSRPTVKRWATRYADGQLMTDRSSRPHTSPQKTTPATTKRIVSLRLRKRIGPVQLAALTGVAPSTAHRVLRRCQINRLNYLDRATGDRVRRYEHPHPGSMIHVDVKKLGNIPDGGGWRFVGRAQGTRNRAQTKGKPKNRHHSPKMGYAFVHTVIDDHSRVAYAEIHDDETAATAVAVLRRAVIWYADRGVTIERVLSDNGAAYVSHLWRDTCTELQIKHSRTRPRRPQTNGKIERFHRTLADGWGYARCYSSEDERRAALSAWLHTYNHHRPHTAIGNKPPSARLINLSDQYT
ncbi:IS481 family transposase [Streptomyces sp. NPDC051684]|uniref:IS481 family transposase n=1 Tax=Streptomyces sp. NPDC051684 TaxID=3365670 RepID=UPI00379CCA97